MVGEMSVEVVTDLYRQHRTYEPVLAVAVVGLALD